MALGYKVSAYVMRQDGEKGGLMILNGSVVCALSSDQKNILWYIPSRYDSVKSSIRPMSWGGGGVN